jgi:hypothetical protein
MSDRNIVLASLQAFFTNPSDTHAQALRPHLADDLTVSVHTTNETSADSAITALQQSLFHHVVHGGQWEEPQIDGDTVTQVLAMPAKGIAAGCRFRLTFNERAKLGRIEGEWMLPPAQLTPEPVLLTAAMRARLNDAEKDKMPVLFAYVTPAGRPEQIYGSGTHVHGDDQLAFWNPRADGSFVKSIAVNPRVSGIYRHDETHEMLEIAGRARVVEDADAARRIREPGQGETAGSAEHGVAVIIDLDRVTGLIHAAETHAIERILMVREGAR